MYARHTTFLGGSLQIAATALLSSLLTAAAITAMQPEDAHTTAAPAAAVQPQYPYEVSGTPSVRFETHDAFMSDYVSLKQDIVELRRAIDYDADLAATGPSLHEWADQRAPGTFGGGRKP